MVDAMRRSASLSVLAGMLVAGMVVGAAALADCYDDAGTYYRLSPSLLRAIARAGTGVLLVEHHADLIFDICHHVTVLNLGRMLAAGTPAEIRSHREVVHAYLGG